MVLAEISLAIQVTNLIIKIAELTASMRKSYSSAQMKKWEQMLKDLECFLRDAEEQQSKQPGIRSWLNNLHRLTFKVEDILEDLNCEATRRQMEPKALVFSSLKRRKFDRKMAPRIEEITAELVQLTERKKLLNLSERGESSVLSVVRNWDIPPCGSMAVDSALHGRQPEKAILMKALLSDCEGIGVIPIFGMGGIGKTTLARHVYDSSQAKETFKVRAWFSVSQNFDFPKICDGLLEDITRQPSGLGATNTILTRLSESLEGKKYLIVIDDLWNDREADWRALRGALRTGSAGSKIVVTTRKKSVAIMVKTSETYVSLEPISDEECWKVFCGHAGVEPEGVVGSEREKIGRELVRRCHGLPLAAALLGGVLMNTDNLERWKDLLRGHSDRHRDVRSVMMHSYNDLPWELKRCFSLFAMFPEDYHFTEKEIVMIWVAEGMAKWEEMNDLYEHRYFAEFKRRSLLANYGMFDSMMHDMVRDMACEIAGKSCSTLNSLEVTKLATVFDCNETRCLYVEGDECLRALCNHVRSPAVLRTIIITSASPNHLYLNDLFLKLAYLRTLVIEKCPSISELPESIGKLAHLRYLHIHDLGIKHLPKSVVLLHNLEMLVLSCCDEVLELPSLLGKLKNLKLLHLDGGCYKIVKLPDSIGDLSNLENLLLHCANLKEIPPSVIKLNNLKHLKLFGCNRFVDIPDSVCQLPNLEILSIKHCPNIENLSSSIGCLKNLKRLELINCPKIVYLPESIGLLYNLELLEIRFFDNLERIPSSIGGMENLKRLVVYGCPKIARLPENINLLSNLKIEFDISENVVGDKS